MKSYLLPAALCGSIALVSYVLPAAALSPVEIQRIAKQTTIQITGCNFGSGVIIRKNGNTYTVLTVAHNFKKSGCLVTAPDNTKYPVERIKTFPNSVDLAVFTFTSNKDYQVAKLIDNSDRIETGETIYVSGFALSTAIKSSVFTSVKGDVVANPSTQQEKGYSLIYSNNTLPGQSGGPVWNDRGELIAIHGQGDVDSKSQETINANVRVKTGYNLGITANTFVKLATTVGISGYAPVTLATREKSVENLLASALIKRDKGDYRGMLVDLDRVISLDPQNARAYSFRGVAKYELRDREGAVSDINQAIAIDPNYAYAYADRGRIEYKGGSKQQALADFNRAIALKPNYASAYAFRGDIKFALDDIQGAVSDYNRAIAIDPNNAYVYYACGRTLRNSGDFKGAIPYYLKAAKIFKNQGQTDNYKEVMEQYESLLEKIKR